MSSLFDSALFCNGEGEGRARRDAALALLRVRRAELVRDCARAALSVALEQPELTADDVRALVPIPPGISPKLVGVVFRDLADAGIIRRSGYRNSARPAAHARALSVWTLADRDAAAAQLAALSTAG